MYLVDYISIYIISHYFVVITIYYNSKYKIISRAWIFDKQFSTFFGDNNNIIPELFYH